MFLPVLLWQLWNRAPYILSSPLLLTPCKLGYLTNGNHFCNSTSTKHQLALFPGLPPTYEYSTNNHEGRLDVNCCDITPTIILWMAGSLRILFMHSRAYFQRYRLKIMQLQKRKGDFESLVCKTQKSWRNTYLRHDSPLCFSRHRSGSMDFSAPVKMRTRGVWTIQLYTLRWLCFGWWYSFHICFARWF